MKCRIVLSIVCVLIVLLLATWLFVPAMLDSRTNQVQREPNVMVSEAALNFHQSLLIGDWHSDSLLWNRQLAELHDYGHMDLPRLQQGNVALQMFTTVTKSPSGLNYQKNSSDAADNITRLALLHAWPMATWSSLSARALVQADALQQLALNNPKTLMLIRSKRDLAEFLERRQSEEKLIGGMLGTEGSHALDGKLENIDVLFKAGFRMMSLHHFFDNKLGGSLHGIEQGGLTEFGAQVVEKVNQLDIILDVSHSSEQAVNDVLRLSSKPLVVSHTGFKGHCPSERNISDQLMQSIADKGGLIAVGYWDGAVCGTSPKLIAEAIAYGVTLVGDDHVALGSDYDGATTVAFDTSELILLTQALLDEGLSEQQIRKVMGENMLKFLQGNLP